MLPEEAVNVDTAIIAKEVAAIVINLINEVVVAAVIAINEIH